MNTKDSQTQTKRLICSASRWACLLVGSLVLCGFSASEAQGQKIKVDINIACYDESGGLTGLNDGQIWIGGVFIDLSNPPRGSDRVEIDPGTYVIRASRKSFPGAVIKDIYSSGPGEQFPRKYEPKSRGEAISLRLDRKNPGSSVDYSMRIDLEGCLSGSPAPPPAAPATPTPTPGQKRKCIKTFIVSGIAKNGLPERRQLRTEKRYDEWTTEEVEGYSKDGKYFVGQGETEQKKYSRGGYQPIKNRTKKQDCAGYVMDQLWKTGLHFVTAPRFYDAVIDEFGQKISGNFGWGSVRPNDIVVYGDKAHIAIVKEVQGGTIRYTSIFIETKDGEEMVYRTDLLRASKFGAEDPLVRAYGTPQIYRVDPNKVSIVPMTPGECDESGATTNTGGVPSGTSGTGVDFTLHSDAHLSITDQSTGRKLGFNDQGGIDEDLPTGTFLSIGGVEYASIADIDRALKVTVTGIREGRFTLDVDVKRAGTTLAQFSYPEVPVRQGTVAEVTMTPGQVSSSPSPLAVTTDGRTTTIPASVGNAGAPIPMPAGPLPPSSSPSSGGIGGTWIAPTGDIIELVQNGNTINGSYRGVLGTGSITGTFDGRTLTGTLIAGQAGIAVTQALTLRLTDDGRLEGQVGSPLFSVSLILTRR